KEAVAKHVSAYTVRSFFVVGRTALLEGFIETLESAVGIPVKMGRITHPEILSACKDEHALAGHKHLTYLISLGIICSFLHNEENAGLSSLVSHSANPFLKMVDKIKEVYQEYF
ncbi:MAG: hypothetical protein KKC84_07005, partial [Candidatus Omnitrophica bacterium]|nr:hypothetical protein [Candidatus Omnitrophota bacterium]